MLPRFLAPALTGDMASLDLPAEEAHHLSKVLRLRQGDALLVFDGAGLQRHARVAAISRSGVTVDLGSIAPAAPELRVRVVLAQALLKGDSMDRVIRDATTIGIHAVVPVVTTRIEMRLPEARLRARVERWQRVAAGAAKQCGRAVVPHVHEPVALPQALALAAEQRVMLVEPPGDRGSSAIGDLRRATDGGVLVLVGPEGGWTPEENALAGRGGAVRVSLGGRTLRAETVAIAGLPVLLHAMGVWP